MKRADNDWEEKIWGKTLTVVDSEYYSEHDLQIKAGGYCSLHYHMNRANQFKVLEGKVLIIEVFGLSSIKKTMLGPGNIYNVPSLIPHMFVVYVTGEMIECYYPDRGGIVMISDIVRIIEGGTLNMVDLDLLPQSIIKEAGIYAY